MQHGLEIFGGLDNIRHFSELELKKAFRNCFIRSRCLKITEKVSFNIASEASYVDIFSGQKLIKNAKNGPFGRVLKT